MQSSERERVMRIATLRGALRGFVESSLPPGDLLSPFCYLLRSLPEGGGGGPTHSFSQAYLSGLVDSLELWVEPELGILGVWSALLLPRRFCFLGITSVHLF